MVRFAWVLLVVVGCGSAEPLIPTPNLLVGSTDAFATVPAELAVNEAVVVYATDRKPEPGDALRFGTKRSRSLRFGTAGITFGKDVSWEELVRQSTLEHRTVDLALQPPRIVPVGEYAETPHERLLENGELVDLPSDLRKSAEADEALAALIRQRIALTPRKELFLYIHGVANTFDEAVFRVAELWHFFGRTGVPVAYSWPAGSGGLRGYGTDRESGEFTIHHLKRFLRTVCSVPEVKKLNVLCHSRGNDIFMTALRELHLEFRGAGKNTRTELKLGLAVMAAADIDVEVATQRISAERVGNIPELMVIYQTKEDLALRVANWLFRGVLRVGQIWIPGLAEDPNGDIALALNLDVVEVEVATDFVGHAYFYESPAVTSDLVLLFRDGKSAGADNGRPLQSVGKNRWRLDDSYPRRAP